MNLDEMNVYVFIRQDLPDWQQLCHSNHATFQIALECGGKEGTFAYCSGHPSVILIGVPDQDALKKACDDLRAREVKFIAWTDPDAPQLGLLSLATEPLNRRDRNKLHSYRPWERKNNTFGKGAPKNEQHRPQ